MYLVINQTSKEFALLSYQYIAYIESLQDQYYCADIFYDDIDEIANLSQTIEDYESKGYQRVAFNNYTDLLYFTIL